MKLYLNANYKELKILCKREFKNIYRNKLLGAAKIFDATTFGFFIGILFYNIASKSGGKAQNTGGFLYSLLVNVFWTSLMGCVDFYYADFDLLVREFRSNVYGLLSYFCAKLFSCILFFAVQPLIAVPILYYMSGISYSIPQFIIFMGSMLMACFSSLSLGVFGCCVFESASVALLLIPCIILPVYSASGYTCNPNDVNIIFKVLQYISPVRFCLNILYKNHYNNVKAIGDETTDNILSSFYSIRTSFIFLICYVLLMFTLSYLALILKIRNKF